MEVNDFLSSPYLSLVLFYIFVLVLFVLLIFLLCKVNEKHTYFKSISIVVFGAVLTLAFRWIVCTLPAENASIPFLYYAITVILAIASTSLPFITYSAITKSNNRIAPSKQERNTFERVSVITLALTTLAAAFIELFSLEFPYSNDLVWCLALISASNALAALLILSAEKK